MTPRLLSGRTWHGRRGASVENAFAYSVDFVLLDAEVPAEGPSLFSRDRFNALSLRTADHGGMPGLGTGAVWARAAMGPCDPGGRLMLLAQPRVLGHTFNPVSFWLAYDPEDRLRVVIAEVTNTYGDRHSYLCHRDDLGAIGPHDTLTARKCFHVSPFQDRTGDYRFRFDIGAREVRILIDLKAATAPDTAGVTATLTGTLSPLTNRAILRAVLRRPFGSRRVLALIHWQALVLWWKGAGFRARPEPPDAEISR